MGCCHPLFSPFNLFLSLTSGTLGTGEETPSQDIVTEWGMPTGMNHNRRMVRLSTDHSPTGSTPTQTSSTARMSPTSNVTCIPSTHHYALQHPPQSPVTNFISNGTLSNAFPPSTAVTLASVGDHSDTWGHSNEVWRHQRAVEGSNLNGHLQAPSSGTLTANPVNTNNSDDRGRSYYPSSDTYSSQNTQGWYGNQDTIAHSSQNAHGFHGERWR